LTIVYGCDTLFADLTEKRNDEESNLEDILQRNPVVSIKKKSMLRGMNEMQMNMAFERRTEPETFSCKTAMGSPFIAKKCWLALAEVLLVRAE
jgi:hypothetical protein